MDFIFTSELSAVNSMIGTIGEAPVSTLIDTDLVDVETALTVLREETRKVLAHGWDFNTDCGFPLMSDPVTNHIKVPQAALQVRPDNPRYTVRGSMVYDKDTFSLAHPAGTTITATVYWAMAFEELPEVTRQYITTRACRLFQNRTAHSQIIRSFTQEDETEARVAHERENTLARRDRFIHGDSLTRSIIMR